MGSTGGLLHVASCGGCAGGTRPLHPLLGSPAALAGRLCCCCCWLGWQVLPVTQRAARHQHISGAGSPSGHVVQLKPARRRTPNTSQSNAMRISCENVPPRKRSGFTPSSTLGVCSAAVWQLKQGEHAARSRVTHHDREVASSLAVNTSWMVSCACDQLVPQAPSACSCRPSCR